MEILGVSQFLVQSGRIVREVRIYDEIGLRTQIAGHRGDGPVHHLQHLLTYRLSLTRGPFRFDLAERPLDQRK